MWSRASIFACNKLSNASNEESLRVVNLFEINAAHLRNPRGPMLIISWKQETMRTHTRLACGDEAIKSWNLRDGPAIHLYFSLTFLLWWNGIQRQSCIVYLVVLKMID